MLDATLVHLHFVEHIFKNEVKSATAVHALVSQKPSTIGFKTKAAGAWTDRALGSSAAEKVMAVSLQRFIVVTWLTSATSRSARLHRLFGEKVSKTVKTLKSSSFEECFSGGVLVRIAPALLATCRSTQHARRLCVGSVLGVLCI